MLKGPIRLPTPPKWLGLALGLLLGCAPAVAIAAAPPVIRQDPAIVSGTLPNGLRYAVVTAPSHRSEVIRFRIEAGSRDEADDERGLAHLLEHMAFRGGAHFASGELVKRAETMGIGFGRDQNAHTYFDRTEYELTLANLTQEKLDFSFTWLSDIAFGMKLDPDDVAGERAVVWREYMEHLGPGPRVGREIQMFMTPGLRSTWRDPAGSPTVLNSATAQGLRAYYQRWYQPGNAIIVAVGDAPAGEMVARIKAAFGGWSAATPSPRRPALGDIRLDRARDALDFPDARALPTLDLCRFGPPTPQRPDDFDYRVEEVAKTVLAMTFERRVQRIARAPDPPFIEAKADFGDRDRAFEAACYTAKPRDSDWRAAVAALTEEARRLELYGVTPSEFAFARDQILMEAEISAAVGATRSPEMVAEPLSAAIAENRVYTSPKDTHAILAAALGSLNADKVNDIFARRWRRFSPPLLAYGGDGGPQGAADISAVWNTALAKTAPDKPLDRPRPAWAYGGAVKPGAIAEKIAMKDPDFTRVIFANGVVLNLKTLRTLTDSFWVQVVFGAGQHELPPQTSIAANLGGRLLLQGGLKRHSFDDLQEVLAGHETSIELEPLRDRFELTGYSRPEDAEIELQLLYAYFTEPGFRPEMAAGLASTVHTSYRSDAIDPAQQVGRKLGELRPTPHVQDWPSEQSLAELSAADFERLLRRPLTEDALEVSIVGDFDEAKVIAAASRTFGALAPRERRDRTRSDAVYVRYAAEAPAPVVTHHLFAKDAAAVLMAWPLFVYEPAHVHDGRVVRILAALVQDQLTARIREKLGKAYSPTVQVEDEFNGDQYSLQILIRTSPDAVDAVEAEARAIGADIAAGKFTEADFEQARRPTLDELAQERTYNAYWLRAMAGSYEHPEELMFARTRMADYAAISFADVRAAAARWLGAKPYVVASVVDPGAKP
jgi:zinc protease